VVPNIKGYEWIGRDKNKESGKFGGIGCWIRKSVKFKLQQVKSEGNMEELMWVVGTIEGKKVAVGVEYLGCGAQKRERNLEVLENMGVDILKWDEDGYEVCIMGDFNAHVGKRQGPMKANKKNIDWLGKELINRWGEWGMELLNESKLCERLWTQMQSGQKTVIDYMVGSEGWNKWLTRMVVEDDIVDDSDSDHNLLWAQFEWSGGKHTEKETKEEWVWKMTDQTDWSGFSEEVERVITEGDWVERANKVDTKEELERHMRSWIDVLSGARVEKVGFWSRKEGREKRKWTEELSKDKKDRKSKGKAWKRALKMGDKKIIVKQKWKEYKQASEKFRVNCKEEEYKEQRKSMDNILEKGGGSSKEFWKHVRKRKDVGVSTKN
jgi:hypothetical protein